jgi:hypothetical protein
VVIPTADRDFKGVWIPKEVWLDERLSMLDKGILAEVDSLDMGENGCFASNEHLAEFCQCSVTKVSTSITKLVDLGYLSVRSFDGRKRFLKSSLSKNERQTFKNCKADFQKVKDSNTSIRSLNKPAKSILCDYPGFDDFWKVYPRHVAKQNALKSWKALKPNDELLQAILADVNRRLGGEWRGKDMQYIPHPSTYLNQRRWEDETEVTKVAEHREPDAIVLTAEEEREIERIYAQNGRDAWM